MFRQEAKLHHKLKVTKQVVLEASGLSHIAPSFGQHRRIAQREYSVLAILVATRDVVETMHPGAATAEPTGGRVAGYVCVEVGDDARSSQAVLLDLRAGCKLDPAPAIGYFALGLISSD